MTLHERFRTHTATVTRRTRTTDGAGGWVESWTAAGTVTGSLQPVVASEATSQADREVALARWNFYTDPDVDLVRDDRVTIDGRVYDVVSVGRWDADTSIDHWAYVLEERQIGT